MPHVGDQDPSGVAMFASLAGDLIAFAGSDADIEVVRIAILPAQTLAIPGGRRALPSAPPKVTDKRRYDRMLIRHRSGERPEYVDINKNLTWQAEALDPPELAGIVRAAIDARFNRDAYEFALRPEQEVRRQVLARLGS
jgi:hypothetical protein